MEEPHQPSQLGQSTTSVALAIAFAGVVIALSIYFVFANHATTTASGLPKVTIPAVTTSDHILGNPDAPIKIVEYADLDCPYCRQFEVTMKQIMSTYGANGQVAWVFRQFPIKELHPNAPKLAEAAECVASLGGNTAFWKFIDAVFTSPPANGSFDMSLLNATAVSAGVATSDFEGCLQSGKMQAVVQKAFDEATKAGAQGTPQNYVVTAVDTIPIPGAQPYATVQSIIDTVLASTPAKN